MDWFRAGRGGKERSRIITGTRYLIESKTLYLNRDLITVVIISVIAILIIMYVLVFRFPKHRQNFCYLINLIFFPRKFTTISAEEAIKKECKTNIGFKERYNQDEKWKNEQIASFNEQFLNSTQQLRNSIYQAFITVLITLFSAWAVAYLLALVILIPPNVLSIVQMSSAFLILWAIVGKLGYPIKTIGGESLPENVDNLWFIFLNVIGIFCLFLAQFYTFLKSN